MKKVLNISSKYNTMIMVIVGGLIASLLIGFFLIAPAWGDLKRLGEEIPLAEQNRNLKQQDFENLKQAETFFKENAQTVEQVNTAVPIAPEVPSILVMLESLAKQNGVFLTSFSPQQTSGQTGTAAATGSGSAATSAAGGSNPPGTESVEITANFQGPYPSLLSFLYNLERSLRITDVTTLTVNSTQNGLEGTITFKTYYTQVEGGPKPTQTAAPGTAPAAGGSK